MSYNAGSAASEIERLLEELATATDELLPYSQAADEARYRSKLAWFSVIAKGVEGKTAQEREAAANLTMFEIGGESKIVLDWGHERKMAETLRDSKSEQLRSIRASLDSLRTINTNLRSIQ